MIKQWRDDRLYTPTLQLEKADKEGGDYLSLFNLHAFIHREHYSNI